MNNKWRKVRLGDVAEVIGGGTPSTAQDEYWEGDISWITPKDLTGYTNTYINKGERCITQLGLDNSSARLLPEGTVLLTSRAPIGYIAVASTKLCTNQGFKSFIVDKEKLHNLFLYYWLKGNTKYLQSMGTGTTFMEIPGKRAKEIEINLPPLPVQQAIAATLSCLDDKIELNNRINANLEAQAQAVFKSWFVDFEPWKDGDFVESELGRIPKGWSIVTLDDVCTKITDGSHFSPKDSIDGIYPMLSVRDMESYGFNYQSCKLIGEDDFKTMVANDCVPLINDILVAKDGSYLKHIFIVNENRNEAILSSIAIFRPNPTVIYPEFLLCLLKYPSIQQTIRENYVSGSALPRIVLKDFKKLKLVLPPITKQSRIFETLSGMRHKTSVNQVENNILVAIRDALLPKLMSGEIEVEE